MTFRDILFIHWFLGVGIAIVAAIWAVYKKRERRLFVFGGDLFSLGDQHQWIKWYICAYIFEVLTSLFYFKSGMMYVELAMSIWQAGLFTVGAFMIDRVFTLFTTTPTPTVNKTPDLSSMKEAFKDITASARRTTENAHKAMTEKVAQVSTPKVDPNQQKSENEAFDNLTKGR